MLIGKFHRFGAIGHRDSILANQSEEPHGKAVFQLDQVLLPEDFCQRMFRRRNRIGGQQNCLSISFGIARRLQVARQHRGAVIVLMVADGRSIISNQMHDRQLGRNSFGDKPAERRAAGIISTRKKQDGLTCFCFFLPDLLHCSSQAGVTPDGRIGHLRMKIYRRRMRNHGRMLIIGM